MKIIVIDDEGTEREWRHVSDYYLAIRQLEPLSDLQGVVTIQPETRSYSCGAQLRELTKEVAQSLVELQDVLGKMRAENGR